MMVSDVFLAQFVATGLLLVSNNQTHWVDILFAYVCQPHAQLPTGYDSGRNDHDLSCNVISIVCRILFADHSYLR